MVSITFAGQSQDIEWNDIAYLRFCELQDLINEKTNVPPENQKLFAPKLLKNVDPEAFVHELLPENIKKIMIIGTATETLSKLQESETTYNLMQDRRTKRLMNMLRLSKRPVRTINRDDAADYKYTFTRILTLPGYPDEERAYSMLLRLKNDRGVQAVMKKYKWQVGTLTELDPAQNTAHDHMKLGLNTNKGEKISLRIRTDDYKGFCNYTDVRNILCHELAHNVHSEHDRDFWELTKKLEREVVTLDPYGDKGHALAGDVYSPAGPSTGPMSEELSFPEEATLVGGSYRLSTPARKAPGSDDNVSARELLRKAAEERQQREGSKER